MLHKQVKFGTKMTTDEFPRLLSIMSQLDHGDNVGAGVELSEELSRKDLSPEMEEFVQGLEPWASFIGGDDATAKNIASRRNGNTLSEECASLAKTFGGRPIASRYRAGPRRREWLRRAIVFYSGWQSKPKRWEVDDATARFIQANLSYAVGEYNKLSSLG